MEILYRDEEIIAVDKPAGMLVHKTKLAPDVTGNFALQTVRDVLGKKIYPVHRIDRPTSGVLLFALNREMAAQLMGAFQNRVIRKVYTAIVRGYCPETGEIKEPLKKENGILQKAETFYKKTGQAELPFSSGSFPTSRYSWVEVYPKTGRMHQIRKHFAKIRHYLIGDTKYGDLKQNRAFENYTGVKGLMLHASMLEFVHPGINENLRISSPIPPRFIKVLPYFEGARLNRQ